MYVIQFYYTCDIVIVVQCFVSLRMLHTLYSSAVFKQAGKTIVYLSIASTVVKNHVISEHRIHCGEKPWHM